jgi:hypothetical protein
MCGCLRRLNEVEMALVVMAAARYGGAIEDCTTPDGLGPFMDYEWRYGGKTFFFNDASGSTHIVNEKMLYREEVAA